MVVTSSLPLKKILMESLQIIEKKNSQKEAQSCRKEWRTVERITTWETLNEQWLFKTIMTIIPHEDKVLN